MLAAIAALAFSTSAAAQNLSLRGPAWAQPLLASDVVPTNGGRAALNEPGVDVAARITIAPNAGGVARVVRFEARGDQTILALRRFTGHPTTGWWMWGPDTPTVTTPSAAVRQELTGLVRAAIGVGGAVSGGAAQQACPAGEQVFVELALAGRSTTATRACVSGDDAVGRLARRLSDLAGSRNEEELHAAAIAEVMAVDRAFAGMAAAQGISAAFAEYAAPDAIHVGGGAPLVGHEALSGAYRNLPAGTRIEWSPTSASVSSRGDMAWTWGESVQTAPGQAPRRGRYVTIWKRDYEGRWRFAFDGALR